MRQPKPILFGYKQRYITLQCINEPVYDYHDKDYRDLWHHFNFQRHYRIMTLQSKQTIWGDFARMTALDMDIVIRVGCLKAVSVKFFGTLWLNLLHQFFYDISGYFIWLLPRHNAR